MSKLSIITFAMMTGLGISAMAFAQNTAQTSQGDQGPASADHQAIKPGDRNCLRETGSLIPARKGECLPVAGRSYSSDELRRTGATNTGRALQMLDPSIGIGH